MVDLNGEKKSKPVYVGKETGKIIPEPNILACFTVSAIVVLAIVILVVIWAVTR